jgi:hypothetical protein
MNENLSSFVEKCEELRTYSENCLEDLQINRRSAIYAAHASISYEHFASMLMLIRNHCPASAAALARPHFETLVRGMWINLMCDDSDIEKLFAWKRLEKLPKIVPMLDDIDKGYGADGAIKSFHAHWKTLCGLTHGGPEQLCRRFLPDGKICSSFSEEDLVKILKLTADASTFGVIPLLVTLGEQEKADGLHAFHSKIFGWSN